MILLSAKRCAVSNLFLGPNFLEWNYPESMELFPFKLIVDNFASYSSFVLSSFSKHSHLLLFLKNVFTKLRDALKQLFHLFLEASTHFPESWHNLGLPLCFDVAVFQIHCPSCSLVHCHWGLISPHWHYLWHPM